MTPEEIARQRIPDFGRTLLSEERKHITDAMQEYAIHARIQERRDCIYLLEQSLMDTNWAKTYKRCMQDEIANHKAFIEELEKELLTLK